MVQFCVHLASLIQNEKPDTCHNFLYRTTRERSAHDAERYRSTDSKTPGSPQQPTLSSGEFSRGTPFGDAERPNRERRKSLVHFAGQNPAGNRRQNSEHDGYRWEEDVDLLPELSAGRGL